MSIEFIWRLPTGADGRYGNAATRRRGERASADGPYFTDGVSDPRGDKFNYLDHLQQVARAADLTGFDGIQISNDPQGDESWIVAGYVARGTRHLRLLTEFDASRGSAVYAAKNAVSYQRYTHGRFAWQIGTGGTRVERQRQGDFVNDSDIAPRIEEFVTVARGVLASAPYSFKGKYFEVLEGGFKGPLSHQALPPVYLSGSSAESYQLSARVADVHVFDALPVDELEIEIAKLKALARSESRTLEFGLRIDLLARETEDQALFDVHRQLAQTKAEAPKPAPDSHFCAGIGAGTAKATLVGSYAQVIALLADYAEAGIGSFILAALPHLEEAYRIGENILPDVRRLISPASRSAA
jgi:alkanesulfonate monooxygenase